MNDLYLIGNGFDLAHGLETSYNHFLLWYFKHIINRISPNKHFEDELTIVDKRFGTPIQDHDLLDELMKECKHLQISIKYKHSFFEHIVSSFRKFSWVDIEYEYFEMLKLSYNQIETYGYSNWESSLEEVKELNSCIEAIKGKLAEYLSSIKIKKEYKNEDICNILAVGNGQLKKDYAEKFFLYFNYTPTMELYSKEFIVNQSEVIYIHGKLNDPSNPIILGYGDEMDSHYEKIEY